MMYNKCFYHSFSCENKNQNIKNFFYKKNLSEMSTLEKRPVRNILGQNILYRNVLGRNVRVRNIRPPNRSAYRVAHSTEIVLLCIKNEIHLSLSKAEVSALVLLDQSAAFDTIDHSTLLRCLQTWFDISGTILR